MTRFIRCAACRINAADSATERPGSCSPLDKKPASITMVLSGCRSSNAMLLSTSSSLYGVRIETTPVVGTKGQFDMYWRGGFLVHGDTAKVRLLRGVSS